MDHSFHLGSPGQSVMVRAGVPNVLYTQCIYSTESQSGKRPKHLQFVRTTDFLQDNDTHSTLIEYRLSMNSGN